MRCLSKSLWVVLVACGASVAVAGPWDKNAASKINGDMIGTPAQAAPAYRVYNAAPAPIAQNRSFSYAPAPATAPARRKQFRHRRCRRRLRRLRSGAVRISRHRNTTIGLRNPQPGYLRVDRKILGTY